MLLKHLTQRQPRAIQTLTTTDSADFRFHERPRRNEAASGRSRSYRSNDGLRQPRRQHHHQGVASLLVCLLLLHEVVANDNQNAGIKSRHPRFLSINRSARLNGGKSTFTEFLLYAIFTWCCILKGLTCTTLRLSFSIA